MRNRAHLVSGLLCAGIALLATTYAAHAVHVDDMYWGGTNSGAVTSSSTGSTVCCGWNKDVIGEAVFNISSFDVTRTDANTLQVQVNTAYAGHAGGPPASAYGTGYGSLFFSTSLFTPTGTGPKYDTDVYQTGRYDYVFAIPQTGTGGSANLYSIDETKIVMSNVYGNPHNPGYIFRQGQAVQYDAGNQAAVAGTSGSYSIQTDTSITFTIHDNGTLGNTFMLMWAITCGNDILLTPIVLQGEDAPPPPGVPLPAALPLFAGGLGLFGMLGWRRRNASRAA